MADTRVTICNLALSHAKQTKIRISNLDTDTSGVADLCRLHYSVVRRFVLSSHNWNFAQKSVELAEVDAASTRYAYAYDMPSDCLRAVELERAYSTDEPYKFMIRGGVLFTDVANAKLVYIYDNDDAEKYSPAFVSALSWYLASELIPALGGSPEDQEFALKIYRSFIGSAVSIDSSEGESDDEFDSPWDQARY